MMMTRLASVAKKSQFPGLLVIPSRTLCSQKIYCHNVEKGLGYSLIKAFRDVFKKKPLFSAATAAERKYGTNNNKYLEKKEGAKFLKLWLSKIKG